MIFGFLPQNLKIQAVAGAFSMAWPGSEVEPRAEDDVPARDRVAAFRGELYRDPAAADRQPRRNPANPAPGTTGGGPPRLYFFLVMKLQPRRRRPPLHEPSQPVDVAAGIKAQTGRPRLDQRVSQSRLPGTENTSSEPLRGPARHTLGSALAARPRRAGQPDLLHLRACRQSIWQMAAPTVTVWPMVTVRCHCPSY